MAFVRFATENVTWANPPAVFASSNLVERGFCNDCGTPLSYRQVDSPNISLTLNSLDNPEAVQPEIAFVAERKAQWLRALDNLPNEKGELTTSPGFVNHQVS